MKMYLGDTQVKNLMLHTDSDDATLVASDLQAGVTAYARGQKVTGTGKSFEFAHYGKLATNQPYYIPSNINVIEIASINYPIQLSIALNQMEETDFTIAQTAGYATIDGVAYELTVQAVNNFLTVSCEKDIYLEIFYGKDNYL